MKQYFVIETLKNRPDNRMADFHKNHFYSHIMGPFSSIKNSTLFNSFEKAKKIKDKKLNHLDFVFIIQLPKHYVKTLLE